MDRYLKVIILRELHKTWKLLWIWIFLELRTSTSKAFVNFV